MPFSDSINAGALGGGRVSAKAATISSDITGVVYQLRAGLTPPVTWSKLSGNANITVASSGAVSVTAALAAGVSQSAIVRGVSGSSAVEYQITLTGRAAPALPVNTIPPSITGTPVVGGAGVYNLGAWTGADTISWAPYIGDEQFGPDDPNPNFTFPEEAEGVPYRLRVTATNQYGSTTAWAESGVVQPSGDTKVLFASRDNFIHSLSYSTPSSFLGMAVRSPHTLVGGYKRLRVRMPNWMISGQNQNHTNGPSTIIITQCYGLIGTAPFRAKFNGELTYTLEPGGEMVSDWFYPEDFGLSGEFPDATEINIKLVATLSSAAVCRSATYGGSNGRSKRLGYFNPAVTNVDAGNTILEFAVTGTAMTNTQLGPFAWLEGEPTDTRDCIMMIGDSFTDGPETAAFAAMADLGVPCFNAAVTASYSRMGTTSARYLALMERCTDAYCQYGTNDLNTATQATAVNNISLHASRARSVGIDKFFVAELLNRTTSINNFADAAGQTIVEGFEPGGRPDQFNTLIADRVGSASDQFTAIIPAMSALTDPLADGKWPSDGTANRYTSDGKHPGGASKPILISSIVSMMGGATPGATVLRSAASYNPIMSAAYTSNYLGFVGRAGGRIPKARKSLVLNFYGLFWNNQTNETNLPNALHFDEVWLIINGVAKRVQMGGSNSFTTNPGDYDRLTDPVHPSDFGLSGDWFSASTDYELRYKITLSATTDRLPYSANNNRDGGSTRWRFDPAATTVDLSGPTMTYTGTAPNTSAINLYLPMVLGEAPADEPVWGAAGDSLTAGAYDQIANGNYGRGWFQLACQAREWASINLAVAGINANATQASTFAQSIYKYATHWVGLMGTNSFGIAGTGQTVANVRTVINNAADAMRAAGASKVVWARLPPRAVSSSDGWLSAAGQTINAGWQEGGRPYQFNDALLPDARFDAIIPQEAVRDAGDRTKWYTDGVTSYNADETHPNHLGEERRRDEALIVMDAMVA